MSETQGKKMTNTEKELLENAPVKEVATSPVFPTTVYSKNASGKVTMKTTVRNSITQDIIDSVDTLKLSEYDLVDKKYLVKQVGTCPDTHEPILVIFEIKVSNALPSKRKSTSKTVNIPKIKL